MFNLDKNKKDEENSPKPFFEFPLEEELKNEEKVNTMIKDIEAEVNEIKQAIKQGADPDNFEKLGTLLHGYSALLKMLSSSIEETS